MHYVEPSGFKGYHWTLGTQPPFELNGYKDFFYFNPYRDPPPYFDIRTFQAHLKLQAPVKLTTERLNRTPDALVEERLNRTPDALVKEAIHTVQS